MRITTILVALIVSCTGLCTAAQASWLSRITGVHVNVNGGKLIRIDAPQPQAIPEMLRNLPKDAAQAILSPHGTALATAIRHARGQARPSAQPIPPNIKAALAPYFPPNILDKTRWAKRNNVKWALDTAVMMIAEPAGITLDDVIIFNDEIDPLSTDPATLEIWAHELTHVVQYGNMGVESFAFIYSYRPNDLEEQAYSNAGAVKQRTALAPQAGPGQYYQSDYSSLHQIGSQQITTPQLQQSAMSFVSPSNCVNWQTNGPGAVLRNTCTVPIGITGWTQINPWNGAPFALPCGFNCVLAPGEMRQFVSAQPGMWVNVGFSY